MVCTWNCLGQEHPSSGKLLKFSIPTSLASSFFSCYERDILIEEVEKLILEAKRLLPPAKQES